jgi:hypothetical protein
MEQSDVKQLNDLTVKLTEAREMLGRVKAIHESAASLVEQQVAVYNKIAEEHRIFVQALGKKVKDAIGKVEEPPAATPTPAPTPAPPTTPK